MISKFNNKLAVLITNGVGTMYCAYLFTVIGAMGIYYSLSGNTKGTLVIGSISGYFLQLVLLPIIIVGQNIQAQKHDDTLKAIKKIHQHLNIKGK